MSERKVILELTPREARTLASLLGQLRLAFEGVDRGGYKGTGPLSGVQGRLEEAIRAAADRAAADDDC